MKVRNFVDSESGRGYREIRYKTFEPLARLAILYQDQGHRTWMFSSKKKSWTLVVAL